MIEKLKKQKYLPYLIIIIVAAIICLPLFFMKLGDYNEFRIHITRIVNIKETIANGIFPPFISSKHMLGFGYALNIFYGVFTTYVPILISFITGSSITSIKIFTILSVIFSAIAMYKFTNEITKNKTISLIASLIYILAPYKLTDIYSRNAVGEYTAFIFIPIVFMGVYRSIQESKKGHFLIIAGASLLILTHTISSIYTALFIVIYLIFNRKKITNKQLWIYYIIDIAVIGLLTSFYLIPIIEHKLYGDYAIFNPSHMGTSGLAVYNNTNTPIDWFRSELSNVEINFSFGLVITILSIFTILVKDKVKIYKNEYNQFGILAIISLYMCTKLFPWIFMPQLLTTIQFAWRINGFFIFFIAFICGVNAYNIAIMAKKNKNIIIITIISTMVLLSGIKAFSYINRDYNYKEEMEFEEVLLSDIYLGPYNVNREYLPVKVNPSELDKKENKTIVLSGHAKITYENKEELKDSIKVEEVENLTSLELPYIYYHGYEVKINGIKIPNYESENGFVAIDIEEDGEIQIEYKGTTIEKVGYLISTISLIAFIGFISYTKYSNKEHMDKNKIKNKHL